MKPKLLDLFCGAGGASRGYDLAGFDVYGVDIQPQPNYSKRLHRGLCLLRRVITHDPNTPFLVTACNGWVIVTTAATDYAENGKASTRGAPLWASTG